MINNQKIYSSKELNMLIGYQDFSGSNSGKQAILTRCKNAGLIVKALPTKRGVPNQYIIVEDNFHLQNEEWVKCYCNKDWEVSNLGRIRKISTKKLLGDLDQATGYYRVSGLDENGKQTRRQVNRLIFFSFNPNLIPQEKNIQIDHINGVRADNRLDNLRPLTSVENIQQRDENQSRIKSLTTELILKFGYEETEKKLKKLLTNN